MNSKLDDFLPYKLSTTSNAVSDVISSEYKSRFGLKVPEWRIMAVLGDRGTMTQRDLVDATLMDKVMINRAVKGLVDRALLERAPNKTDGRSHHLTLSETGSSLYEQIMPAAEAMEKKIMAVLSPTELNQLSKMLAKIRKSVGTISHS